ncbi:MAG: NADH-quinone oxidoreductase subunit N [Candidatus Acidiferrales bacterium]|jgi:NADH-quinone oxidoreductase subunit N
MSPVLRENFFLVAPEVVWCLTGTLLMLLAPFWKRLRHASAILAILGAALGTMATIFPATRGGSAFGGLVSADSFSVFFHVLVGIVAVLVILGAASYLERERLPAGEFFALLLFATAGMGVLAGAQEMLTAFIGLEMSSIASYILAGYRRDALFSNESAMKYFLLGSFATAFFLYGIALLYGATGTTLLPQMQKIAAEPLTDARWLLLKLGLALVFIGLAFKVAAAPFQVWTPDVYEGAPTPVTALFSAGPKAAAFALFLRIFSTVTAAHDFWFWAVWIVAALTMFIGNLGALVQTNVKRMLAYSSIAHAGYILVAFAARSEIGVAAVLYYLLAYAMMKVGAFTLVGSLSGAGERRLHLDDYAGLGQRQPYAAAAFSLYLLSLLGLPITAGFLGKFYIFKAALNSHLIWLAILMAVNSVIGAYYYLRVIVVMYMRESKPDAPTVFVPYAVRFVLFVTAAGILYFGLFPNRLMSFAMNPHLFGR